MKFFEWFLNLLLFTFYKWDMLFTSVLDYIISFKWINYLIPNKKIYYDDKFHILSYNSNMNVNYAVSGLAMVSIFIQLSLYNIFHVIYKKISHSFLSGNTETLLMFFPISIVISLIIGYFFIFKDKKYKRYFEIFNSMPKEKKIKLSIITNAVILFVIAIFFLSLFIYAL